MFKNYKKLLAEFLSFRSISTDPKYLGEIENAVIWLKGLFEKNNFNVEVWKGEQSNPVVFAAYQFNKKAKTILIYGHYDVQPASKKDGWKSEPFELTETKTKLVGRGVIDNKGQVLIHIATVFDLIKNKNLKYNVMFLIEGNEETGNPDLADLMKKNQKKLKCDILMVSDGELTNNKPTIEVSLRGGFSCTLVYKTAKNNLHSGLAGGAVPNAAHELSKLLSKLYTNDGSISYKAFYDGIDPISKSQLKNNSQLQKQAVNIVKLMGVKSLLMPSGQDFFTQTGLNSTIQITGLKSGYIDTGYSNIVPSDAEVRLNFRLAASQKPEVVANIFERFVKANTPKYVDYRLIYSGMHNPIKVSTNNKYMSEAEKILTKVYKTKVNRKNVGGAIPFVGDVKNILGVDTLLIPLVNEDCNMHGTDENFDIELAQKALEFSREFLIYPPKILKP